MCDPVSITVAAIAAAGTGVSIAQGEAQRDAMNKQMEASKQAAERQAKDAETLQNSTAQKARKATVDPATALYGSQSKGVGSTSLTGPQGVDTSQLMLGKNSLLGS